MFQAEERRNGSNFSGIKPRHQISLGWLRDASPYVCCFPCHLHSALRRKADWTPLKFSPSPRNTQRLRCPKLTPMAPLATQYDIQGADLQSLLPRLLSEGLTPSGDQQQSNPGDLVQVLLEHCILKPLSLKSTVDAQQATYTLAIIRRQATLSPKFLTETYHQGPFYQWLIPRLLQIACSSIASIPTDESVQVTVYIIQILGRDQPDDEDTWAKGPGRAAQILSQLTLFCQGESVYQKES